MSGLVSIIVPVYRARPYVAQTIEMVRQQTWQTWELLLVDDRSGDGSVEAIEEALAVYPHHRVEDVPDDVERIEEYQWDAGRHILLICKKQNEGAAKARNTGLSVATGRYIAFLDADDIWFADKLAREIAFMEEKRAGFVFCAYEFGDEAGRPTGKIVHVPPQLSYRQALSRTVIFTTTVLIDREIIQDKLIRMPAVPSEDTATWWQILRAGHAAYGLDEVLAIYRRPAKSLSSNKFKAVKRIWNLYRRQEGLSVAASAFYFIFWAYRATVRRI